MWLVQYTFRHADTNAINSQRLSSTQCAGRILREWQGCDSIYLIWRRESMKGSQGAGQLNQQCLSSDNSCNTQVSLVDMRARSPWDTVRYVLGTLWLRSIDTSQEILPGSKSRLTQTSLAEIDPCQARSCFWTSAAAGADQVPAPEAFCKQEIPTKRSHCRCHRPGSEGYCVNAGALQSSRSTISLVCFFRHLEERVSVFAGPVFTSARVAALVACGLDLEFQRSFCLGIKFGPAHVAFVVVVRIYLYILQR